MSTFSENIANEQAILRQHLEKSGVDEQVIARLIESGYYMLSELIFDGYYGSFMPLTEHVINMLIERSDYSLKHSCREFAVSSLAEAKEVFREQTKKLNPEIAKRFSFRGEYQRHCLDKRPFPNPFVCNERGIEPSLIPSYWREYRKNYFQRPVGGYFDLLGTIIADKLIYDGIDVQKLVERNTELYGIHSISDLEDFPDEESQEYFRRWTSHKLIAPNTGQLTAISQHYGIKTPALDVTFDLSVALFFALYKYADLGNGKYKYIISDEKHDPVVYCMLFTDPHITETKNMIRQFDVFEHIPPIRPIRQKCALVHTDAYSINDAAAHIGFTLKLNDDFIMDEIPTPTELFPPPEEDAFYSRILDLKSQGNMYFNDIIEYDYT